MIYLSNRQKAKMRHALWVLTTSALGLGMVLMLVKSVMGDLV